MRMFGIVSLPPRCLGHHECHEVLSAARVDGFTLLAAIEHSWSAIFVASSTGFGSVPKSPILGANAAIEAFRKLAREM